MAWRPAKSLIRLRDQINQSAPHRSIASDGTIGDERHKTRNSDHNPWVQDGDLGIVTAIDITHDPDDGCDAEQFVRALIRSRDLRIKYIIWNHRIISSQVQPWVWRSYSGRNPHTKHFHLSVKPDKVHYDSIDAWHIELDSINRNEDGNKTPSRPIEGLHKYRVTARRGLRLREGPGTEYDVVGSLSSRQIVTVLSTSNTWFQVDVEGDGLADGYCHSGYLVPVE
jgi:hypothetical protein